MRDCITAAPFVGLGLGKRTPHAGSWESRFQPLFGNRLCFQTKNRDNRKDCGNRKACRGLVFPYDTENRPAEKPGSMIWRCAANVTFLSVCCDFDHVLI